MNPKYLSTFGCHDPTADTDLLYAKVKDRLEVCFEKAYRLASAPFLTDMFDTIGFRRCLAGYPNMRAAARLSVCLKPSALGVRTYSHIVKILAVDCSEVWIEKQFKYLIDDAYRSGAFARFREYAPGFRMDKNFPITPAEFLAEVRLILYIMAAQSQDV